MSVLINGNVWLWENFCSGHFELLDIDVSSEGIIEAFHSCSSLTQEQQNLRTDRINEKKERKYQVYDMGDSYILPGLMDSHLHADFLSCSQSFVNIQHATTTQDVINCLKDKSVRKINDWIVGYGWEISKTTVPLSSQQPDITPNDSQLTNPNLLPSLCINRYILDQYFPNTPVYLYSVCLHASIVNTFGLQICNIIPRDDNCRHDSIPQLQCFISRGFIGIDKTTGKLNGLFSDTAALRLLCPHFFPTNGLLSQLTNLSKLGLTAIQTCDMAAAEIYREFSNANQLPLRVFHTPWLEDLCLKAEVLLGFQLNTDWEGQVTHLLHLLKTDHSICLQKKNDTITRNTLKKQLLAEFNVSVSPTSTDRLITNRVKIFADGSLGSQTAAISSAYKNPSHNTNHDSTTDQSPSKQGNFRCCSLESIENTGRLCWNHAELINRLSLLKELSLRPEIHVIGDRATDQVLDCLETVGMCGKKWLPVLTHCSVLSPDAPKRMKQMDAIANIQPSFVPLDTEIVQKIMCKNVQQQAYRWRRLLRKEGVICAGGSDAPICSPDPLIGLYDAMFRPSFSTQRNQLSSHTELEDSNLSNSVVKSSTNATVSHSLIPPCALHPEEKLTFSEALHLYTRGAAIAAGLFEEPQENRSKEGTLKLGSIACGYTADFTIVDRDISKNPEISLLHANIVDTYISGKSQSRHTQYH